MVHKRGIGDYIADGVIILIMVFIIVIVMYPFLNALAISLNHAEDTARGGITLYPRRFSADSYKNIVTNPLIGQAYLVSIARTLIGTLTALFSTGIIAYGLSHSKLVGRKFYSLICIIPMYFSGGLIPVYLMIRGMGLFNNFWVYIIPAQIGLFNILLMRTFFQGLPAELEESARIDGANYLTIFFRIVVPVSTPIIATIALFVGVGHWNDWFTGNIYIVKQELKPMMNVLLGIINEAAFAERMAALAGQGSQVSTALSAIGKGRPVNTRSVTMATMFATIIPIVISYPFLQRFFVKGIMVGSVKG